MSWPVHIGDVVADKYEVTKILGQGGMGVVVAARHRELDKLVALKFMHEAVAASGDATDRFLREARAAARLQSEHVGRVLDVGRLATGVPYIVMEYLHGRDLADVADAGALSVAEVCEYMLQTCDAIAEAHAQGIIHRDLKPQNLFLTTRPDGRPLIKVLDFGISKIQSSYGPTATQTAMGTPAYMSPEQMRSARSCDGRADIWSLGVIMYQLLGGVLPFVGDTFAETMLKVISDPLPPLASVRTDLPPALVAVVEKCLRKDRDERFATVSQLADELMSFAPGRRPATALATSTIALPRPTPAPEAATRTTLGSVASELSIAQPGSTTPRSATARWYGLAIAGVAVAAILVLAVAFGGGRSASLQPQTSPVAGPSVDAPRATPDAVMVVEAVDAAIASEPPGSIDAAIATVVDVGQPTVTKVVPRRNDPMPKRATTPAATGTASTHGSADAVPADRDHGGSGSVESARQHCPVGEPTCLGAPKPKPERDVVGEPPKATRKPVGD